MPTNYASLDKMLELYGQVTVMDVEFYDAVAFTASTVGDTSYSVGDWNATETLMESDGTTKKVPVATLQHLKVSSLNQEGPNKTITGGMNADTLLKFGKKYKIEMKNALGTFDILTKFYGAQADTLKDIVAISDRFPGQLTMVGTTFVIDQATGAKQPVKIVIPFFIGDGIMNIAMDAEGDAAAFDLNGDINRFLAATTGTIDSVSGKYQAGADNYYWFYATEDGLTQIGQAGYIETFNRTTRE